VQDIDTGKIHYGIPAFNILRPPDNVGADVDASGPVEEGDPEAVGGCQKRKTQGSSSATVQNASPKNDKTNTTKKMRLQNIPDPALLDADLSSDRAAAAAVQKLPLSTKTTTTAAAASADSAPYPLCEMSTKDLKELQLHIKRLGAAVPGGNSSNQSPVVAFTVGQFSFGITPELLMNNLIGARTSIADSIVSRNHIEHIKDEVSQGMIALRQALHIEQGLRTNDVINFQQQLAMWYKFHEDYEEQQLKQKEINQQLETALVAVKRHAEQQQLHKMRVATAADAKNLAEIARLKATVARMQQQIQALIQIPAAAASAQHAAGAAATAAAAALQRDLQRDYLQRR
jgi:hypothetical protein